jgi:prepilin-type N-terminal cleavage/methylation domain-containing protein
MMPPKAEIMMHPNRKAVNLIELVVVVVIIAIIAAITIPRMSHGAAGPHDSAVIQDLTAMRSALDLYAQEHGGTYPSTTPATLLLQLTTYTDVSGNTARAKDRTHIYGPYLKAVPSLPVGTNKGLNTITGRGPAGTGTFGWYYDGTSMWANDPSTDMDVTGTAYNTY